MKEKINKALVIVKKAFPNTVVLVDRDNSYRFKFRGHNVLVEEWARSSSTHDIASYVCVNMLDLIDGE